MLTITLADELELNAVLDGLGRVISDNSRTLLRLGEIRHTLTEQRDTPENAAALRDNQFAYDVAQAAVSHAMRAQLTICRALGPTPIRDDGDHYIRPAAVL